MELYQLKYFVEVARQRSFTRAAKRLEVATAGLSVQIQKLEKELGTKLFVRGQRQTVLTPAGEVLLEKSQALLGMAESLRQSVSDVVELRAGCLAAAFVPALGTYWLPEVLQKFRREYPCVKLQLEEDDSLGVAARVEDSSVELGFLELPANDQMFEIQKIWEESVMAVLPADHPLALQASLTLNQLAAEAFVVQRGAPHQAVLEACRRAGFEPQFAAECSDKETAIALAEAGLGVLLLPELATIVPRGNLKVVPIRQPRLVRNLGLISRRGRELSVAARAFLDLVRSAPFPGSRPRSGTSELRARVGSSAEAPPSAAAGEPPAPQTLLTPLRFLDRSTRVYSNTAVEHCRINLSYAEFGERVRRLASALIRAGLRTGDRVACICGNIPPMLEAHFGVPLAGGVLVPINPRFAVGETANILSHSGARYLFVDAECGAVLRPLRSHFGESLTIIDIGGEHRARSPREQEYEAFLRTGSSKPLAWPLKHEQELISLNYTSGTTGMPKGVMISHRAAYLNALGNLVHLGLSDSSKLLWTLPMFHCNGWGLVWAATAAGATHKCLRKIEPTTVWNAILHERVTHICGTPVLMARLLDCPERPKGLNHPLTVFLGGAPPSVELLRDWESIGARVIHGYGLTETCGGYVVCERQASWDSLPVEKRALLLLRQGVPFVTGETLRVVDESLRDVPPDGEHLGEVILRGATVTSGYYKEPEATAREFRDGWFHTGDLAVMHLGGYIELRERRRDIVIQDGEHVSTGEIEQTLYRHPAVEEVAVIGIPDRQRGETLKAFVVLKSGLRLKASELLRYCRKHLAVFKCPSQLEFLEKLPRTATGKVQKFVLREREWAGHKRRIHGV